MEIFRTPQRMVPVRVLLADGQKLEGGFYAPATGLDGNPGRLLDRLNDASEEFLPLAGRYETLLNKSWIVTVELASGQQQTEGIESDFAREQKVRIVLAHGDTVEGWVRYLMPEERTRLLDYLNEAPSFIPVIGEQRVTLVHRRFVQSIQELTGVSAVK
ncbi:MAG: hypothetical protein ACE5H7_09005 [Acidiferrobacterales bacterium]